MKALYNASGKTYVIVGSNSGIGKALIQLLHESKAQTIGLDIQPEAHQDIKSFLAKYYSARPTHLEELQPAFEAIQENTSSIDGLINLSGTLASFKSFDEMTPEEWNELFRKEQEEKEQALQREKDALEEIEKLKAELAKLKKQ